MQNQKPLDRENQTLFFLHIPKTAGTTLFKHLDQLYSPHHISPFHNQFVDFLNSAKQKSPESFRFIRGHLPYQAVEYMHHPVRVITFLRDPVTRSISQYLFNKQNVTSPFHKEANAMSLIDFLADSRLRQGITNVATRYLSNETGDLSLALDNLEQLDFIGITEAFNASLALLIYQFSLPPITQYQRLNITKHTINQQDFNDDLLARLTILNDADYAIYERGKVLFKERYQSMLHQLTTIHFQNQSLPRRQLTKQSTIIHDFSHNQMAAVGWHNIEHHPQIGYYCWTGGTTNSSMDFWLTPNSSYLLSFTIIAAISPDILNSLKVTVNDMSIDLESSSDSFGNIQFQGTIPKKIIDTTSGQVHIQFSVSHVQQPTANDPRQLGIAFSEIALKPLVTSTEKYR